MDTQLTDVWSSARVCNVAGALANQASRHPGDTAIHYPAGLPWLKPRYASCTFAELDNLSNSYARGLRDYGIGPGVRTALMLKPGLDFLAIFYALFKSGAIPVLIDPGIGAGPLKQCIEDAAPQAFIGSYKAHLARRYYGWAKRSCEKFISAGPAWGIGGINLKRLAELGGSTSESVLYEPDPDDTAARKYSTSAKGR
jgi:acyl-CoA synthetase (AMP-forming)/AMP-acid ligase II